MATSREIIIDQQQSTESSTSSTAELSASIPTTTISRKEADARFTFPADSSPEIKKNTDLLVAELSIYKGYAWSTSYWLDALGVKEIIKIEVEVSEYGGYDVLIKDKENNDYCILMTEAGGITGIRKGDKNGNLIWAPIY